MPKYQTLDAYVQTFHPDALRTYRKLQQIIASVELDVKERLFAGQVAFYVETNLKATFHGSPVIVMAFFADHVNVFASGNMAYRDQLPDYKFTAKGTMQIPYDKPLHEAVLKQLFADSLK